MKKFKFLLAATLFCFLPTIVGAQLQRNESERELFESVNRERASQGIPPLQWDAHLFKAARQHALLMLNLNKLEHQLPNEPGLETRLAEAGARFAAIAENIAIGHNPETIHDGWMHSAGHRKNILDPRFTSVGIAVVNGPGGLYAVQDFSQAFANLSAEEQEKQVTALLAAKGIHVNGEAGKARKACEGGPAMPGVRSLTLLQFETPDLSELPPEVEKKIRGQASQNVAVGACRTSDAPGFARYRIVLLFF